jgi:hypothetical protein
MKSKRGENKMNTTADLMDSELCPEHLKIGLRIALNWVDSYEEFSVYQCPLCGYTEEVNRS